jgi:hypothetical protein
MPSNWKVVIESVNAERIGEAFVNVVFVNEVIGKKIAAAVPVNPRSAEDVYAALRDFRDKLEFTDDTLPKLPLGQFVDIDAPAPPATEEEAARVAYITDLRYAHQYKTAVAMGLVQADDKDYAATLARIAANYIPAYLLLLHE